MNHLADWIRRHQIVAFFIITFAITWELGFSYSAVMNKGMVFLFPVVAVATCGPALAGITHAAANTGNAVFSNMDPLILILVLAVAALLMILVDRMWKKLPPDHPAVYRAPILVVEDQKET